MVADLWQRKGKINGCFKNFTSVGLRQFQNKVRFQRKDSGGIVLKFSPHFLKDRACSLMNGKHCQPFKIIGKNFDTTPEPFLWKLTVFRHCWRTKEVLFLKQTLILPFLPINLQPHARWTHSWKFQYFNP